MITQRGAPHLLALETTLKPTVWFSSGDRNCSAPFAAMVAVYVEVGRSAL